VFYLNFKSRVRVSVFVGLFIHSCFPLVSAAAEPEALAQSSTRPNILYINADDLGIMDVGYNTPSFQTPHIDTLASEGMLFTNAYAPAANCAPSRAAVHSGQWSPRHGVYTVKSSARGEDAFRKIIPTTNTFFLPDEVYTMAEALKDGGYQTIHLGKYHIGRNPLDDGFDVNVGGDHTGGPQDGYYSPWDAGAMKSWSDTVEPGTHRIDIYVREAIRFMDAHRDQPMFIHFSPYMVHTPLTAVPEYVDAYGDTSLNATYASMVEKLDEAVGRLMTALDELNLSENTLIVFSSDNGGIAAFHTQFPFRAGKGSYYEGGVRVPLIMRWPGKIAPGRVSDLPVNSLDFYPTFMEVTQIKEPKGLDGKSLIPLMTGKAPSNASTQFWHFPIYLQAYDEILDDGRDPLFRTRPGSTLRVGNWKLHEYFEDNALELYDLENDPDERNDLSRTKPELTAQLYQQLLDWRERIKAPIPTQPNPDYDEDVEQAALEKWKNPTSL